MRGTLEPGAITFYDWSRLLPLQEIRDVYLCISRCAARHPVQYWAATNMDPKVHVVHGCLPETGDDFCEGGLCTSSCVKRSTEMAFSAILGMTGV